MNRERTRHCIPGSAKRGSMLFQLQVTVSKHGMGRLGEMGKSGDLLELESSYQFNFRGMRLGKNSFPNRIISSVAISEVLKEQGNRVGKDVYQEMQSIYYPFNSIKL